MIRFANEYGSPPILQQPVAIIKCGGESAQSTINTLVELKKILAEYALRGIKKPIGVSEYELTRTLPDKLKSALPSIEKLENELNEQSKGEL